MNKKGGILLILAVTAMALFGCIGTPTGAADGDFKNLLVRAGPSTFFGLANFTGNVTMSGNINVTGNVSVTGYINSTPNANSVTTATLVNDSVTTIKLANDSVTAIKLANESVVTAKLGAESVTAGKIANGTITSTQLATETVAAANIVNGTITATQLANGSVTPAILSMNYTHVLTASRMQSFNTSIASNATTATVVFTTAFSGTPVVVITPTSDITNKTIYVSAVNATEVTFTMNGIDPADPVTFAGIAFGAY